MAATGGTPWRSRGAPASEGLSLSASSGHLVVDHDLRDRIDSDNVEFVKWFGFGGVPGGGRGDTVTVNDLPQPTSSVHAGLSDGRGTGAQRQRRHPHRAGHGRRRHVPGERDDGEQHQRRRGHDRDQPGPPPTAGRPADRDPGWRRPRRQRQPSPGWSSSWCCDPASGGPGVPVSGAAAAPTRPLHAAGARCPGLA